MALIIRNSTKEQDSAIFAARMTKVQFAALAVRLDLSRVISSTEDLLSRRLRHRRAANALDKRIVGGWLRNGWSTEYLLELNRDSLKGESLRHSLHWAFPQAYYSVFALTLAYFKATGLPEDSHKAVIKKFGQEVMEARYPEALCFAATKAEPIVFNGLLSTQLSSSIAFDRDNPATVDGQIAQFLNATRKLELKGRKSDISLKTKTGTKRKVFRAQDWRQVAEKLGPTSLLSLLYRKRIKANYQDIDTFLHYEIEPTSLYEDLLCVVGAVNFVHEVLIAKAVGRSFLEEELQRLPSNVRRRVEGRLSEIQRLAA
jgi:hypothetical protein